MRELHSAAMQDRAPIAALVFLVALLACAGQAQAAPGLVPGDYCNDVGVKRTPWTPEAKARARGRALDTARALGASRLIRAYHDLIIWREAFGGEASVVHERGADSDGTPEHGLGLHGLALRWHWLKWGADADPGFCTPEVSTVVANMIMRRAVESYGARNLVEVQAVYSGAARCHAGSCVFSLSSRKEAGLCSRLRSRGVGCYDPVTSADLGRRMDPGELRVWALGRARAAVAAWLGRSGSAGVRSGDSA